MSPGKKSSVAGGTFLPQNPRGSAYISPLGTNRVTGPQRQPGSAVEASLASTPTWQRCKSPSESEQYSRVWDVPAPKFRGQPSSVLFLRGLRRKTKELISDHEMGPWSLAGFLSLLLDVLSGHLDRVLASTCSSHHQ